MDGLGDANRRRCKTMSCNFNVAIIFILSVVFFSYQHWNMYNPWDFHVYVMNGEYWFHQGQFFEPFRPPLISFVLGILEFVSRSFAEYAYILLASVFFLYSCFRFSRSAKVSLVYYYAVICGLGFLQRGLNQGTEILALSFLQLFVASLFDDRMAGHWLGFAILSRYTCLSFAPFLLFRKKNIWKDLLICLIVQLPWLVYNQLKYGSYLQSFADLYANNIYFREGMGFLHPWSVYHFLEMTGIMLPFVFIGFFKHISNIISRKNLIINLIALTVIIFYFRTPFKNVRFLFPLLLPISVWTLQGIEQLQKMLSRKTLNSSSSNPPRSHGSFFIKGLLAVFGINLSLATYYLENGREAQSSYRQAVQDLKAYGLDHCDVETNGWVELSYEGINSRAAPSEGIVKSEIASGVVLVLFKNIEDPYYNPRPKFVDDVPVLVENKRYIILGKGCKSPGKFDELYVKLKADSFQKRTGKRTEERPCYILFKSTALQRFCETLSL